MIRILTNLRPPHSKFLTRFSNNKNEDVYVPIRTLKAVRNTVFTIGEPRPMTIPNKILIFTPFLATALDGFINQWTNWTIAGSVLFFWLGFRIINYFHFGKAHQVHTLKLSKDLSKFYITLPNNRYTSKMEQVLLAREKKTFHQKFREQLKNKTLEIPQRLYAELQKSSGKQLDSHLSFLRKARIGVILELDRKDIKTIEFISKKEVRKVIKQNMIREAFSRNRKVSALQPYSAVNQAKNYILIATKPLQQYRNQSIYFIINFQANLDKKYEQYLKALAQGKKIVI